MHINTYETSFGNIVIAANENAIVMVKFESAVKFENSENKNTDINDSFKNINGLKDHNSFINTKSALTDLAAKQLEEYFTGSRQIFDLPIEPNGTEFQLRVWYALLTIPYGETRSYKQIANQIDNVNACRAVGLANNKNPIWIIIPCHRVIGSDGGLTGYGGGTEMKKKLLMLEKCVFTRGGKHEHS